MRSRRTLLCRQTIAAAVVGALASVALTSCVAGGSRRDSLEPATAAGSDAKSAEQPPRSWTEDLDDLVFGDPEPPEWADWPSQEFTAAPGSDTHPGMSVETPEPDVGRDLADGSGASVPAETGRDDDPAIAVGREKEPSGAAAPTGDPAADSLVGAAASRSRDGEPPQGSEAVAGAPAETALSGKGPAGGPTFQPAAGVSRASDWGLRGAKALEAGRLVEAVGHFRLALSVASPEQRWLYLRVLGNLHLALRREEQALQYYVDLIEEDPSRAVRDASIQGNLAVVYYRLGDLDEARKAVDRSLRVRPDAPESLKTLGLIEIAEGREEQGVATLHRAVQGQLAIPEAQVALAEYEERRGEIAAALGRYRFLLAEMERESFRDPVRRWRNLFPPPIKSTKGELRARIDRLESKTSLRGGETDVDEDAE